MKVLMVIDSLRLGGAERVLATLSACAPGAGFDFEVQVLSPPDERRSVMEPVLETAGVPVSYLGLRRLADPRALPRLVRAIRQSGCDVVHAHLEDAATLVPPAARMAGRPAVCSFHHVAVPLGRRAAAKERLAVVAANASARVVFVSRASLESFARVYGGPRPNWCVVENGVDLQAFADVPSGMPSDLSPPPRPPVAAIVGALRGRKCHAVALSAWPSVLARIPQAHLLIVGDGPERSKLEAQARELGIAAHVTFAGTRIDIAQLVSASTLLLLPSEHEALPTTLIEAAACAVPVIASDVDGVPEVVVDGETGVLVPVHDVEALADATVRLLGDEPLCRTMGARARRMAQERFDAHLWAGRLQEIYVCARDGPRGAHRMTPPTRLAVIETSSQGGLLHYATQLADALAQRTATTDLIVPRRNELAAHTGAARRRAILPEPVPRESGLWRIRIVRRAQIALRLLIAWARINWEVRRGGYDALLLTSDVDLWPMALAVLGITLWRGGRRVACICHSVRPLNRWSGGQLFVSSPLLTGLLRVMYSRMDVVFVHGERSKLDFESTWPVARLEVVPHGDERIFSGDPPAPAEEERLLFFGEWRKVKGLSVLMDAFEQLLRRRPQARLTIAGAPCPVDLDPEEVRRWAAGLDGSVRIVDRYVPVEEVPQLFGSARAVVTPYLVGYQSGVVHLAMTMARAVVASDVGDLSSAVLDGDTGLTVPPGDPHALALALERILADEQLAERLGAQARTRLMRESSWEVVAERVLGALGSS